MKLTQHEDGTWSAGSGQHSHEVPAETGRVVWMRDGYHDGVEVYRTEGGEFRFVDLQDDVVSTMPRCILVMLTQPIETVLGGDDVYACDLESPNGLALVGIEHGDRAEAYGEVLWDSATQVPA